MPLANRTTCENGSLVPKKFGWATFVIASLLNLPLSLAGLSTPASAIARSATFAVLVDGQPGAVVVHDEDLDRVRSGAAVDARVGVGVGAADDERRADTAWLADRPGCQRGAVAPVDRGREVGDRRRWGWRR